MATPSHVNSLYGKRSVAQKVLARLLDADRVDVGQEVNVEPDLTVAPDLSAEVVEAFGERADLVWNPTKVVLLPGRASGAGGTWRPRPIAGYANSPGAGASNIFTIFRRELCPDCS